MDVSKPLPEKLLKFFTNLVIWCFSCLGILIYRSHTLGTSLIAPMSSKDKEALAKLFDSTILWSLLGSCAIVFLITSFIAYKIGTQNSAKRIRSVLDQISSETSSVLLNNGSLLVAIAYFTSQGLFALGGLAAWAGWMFFEPTKAKAVVDRAHLRLHIYGDNRVPNLLLHNNIFRWYHLRQDILMEDQAGNKTSQSLSTTLFVSFEREVVISTLRVQSPDIRLPPHEVKEFNQRYAIIAFMGALTAGTLEISIEP